MSNPTSAPTTHSTDSSKMPPRELTLIVAATNKMGIGQGGTLPWTGLKKEMAYFARVTKRASPGTKNHAIMGRKTWDSIPPKFRPLKDRHNIIITRELPPNDTTKLSDHFKAGSLESAIKTLREDKADGRTFVIGGAQIYKAALERKETKRILLTRVLSEFECDTFFPAVLGESGEGEGWKRKSKEELDRWVGETVPEGVQEENGTRYVFEMWEKVDCGGHPASQ